MEIDTIEFNTYLPKACNGYDKNLNIAYNIETEKLIMDYKSEREHFVIKFDRDELGDIDNFIKRFANYENSKTVTRMIRDFTSKELQNICRHHVHAKNGCKDCPLQFMTSTSIDDDEYCVIDGGDGSWTFEDYRNFFHRFTMSLNKPITVKESDLE